MPERLDRVAVSTPRGIIEIPWSSRDQLLHELRTLDNADAIRTAFEAVGASRPVPLSPADQQTLLTAIDTWASYVTVAQLPPGISELRSALADEDASQPDTAA